MATKSRMIQLYVEQVADDFVQEVYPLVESWLILLDPSKRTVIREITAEEYGGVLAGLASGTVNVGLTDRAFVEVMILFRRRDDREHFYAPSHVASPPIDGAVAAILEVRELGFGFSNPPRYSLNRAVGAHAYIDEVD